MCITHYFQENKDALCSKLILLVGGPPGSHVHPRPPPQGRAKVVSKVHHFPAIF